MIRKVEHERSRVVSADMAQVCHRDHTFSRSSSISLRPHDLHVKEERLRPRRRRLLPETMTMVTCASFVLDFLHRCPQKVTLRRSAGVRERTLQYLSGDRCTSCVFEAEGRAATRCWAHQHQNTWSSLTRRGRVHYCTTPDEMKLTEEPRPSSRGHLPQPDATSALASPQAHLRARPNIANMHCSPQRATNASLAPIPSLRSKCEQRSRKT